MTEISPIQHFQDHLKSRLIIHHQINGSKSMWPGSKIKPSQRSGGWYISILTANRFGMWCTETYTHTSIPWAMCVYEIPLRFVICWGCVFCSVCGGVCRCTHFISFLRGVCAPDSRTNGCKFHCPLLAMSPI